MQDVDILQIFYLIRLNKREDRMNEKSTRMSSMPEDEEITTEQTTPEMKSASTRKSSDYLDFSESSLFCSSSVSGNCGQCAGM
ncbi:unnamed protein product [Heterobilharzia americana]|nr:unnamed protein product [Heterobilharzia americana]